jgi:hypothetical protein
MKQLIQIRCKNNKKSLKVETGSTLSDIFNHLNLNMTYPPISAKVNNKVEGMHYRVYNSKDVEFLDLTTPSAMCAIFFSCNASDTFIISVACPLATASLNSPTVDMSSRRCQR